MTLAGGLLLTLLCYVASFWALGRLEESLRADGVQQLAQIVDGRVAAIRVLAERQKRLAREFLDDPALVDQLAKLAETSGSPKADKAALKASASYAAIFDRLSHAPTDIADRGFVVVNPSGLVLCSNNDDMVGRAVASSGAAYLRRIILGEWLVSRPYPDRQFAQGLEPDLARPTMFVGGPVHDENGKLLAICGFRFDPERSFYRLIAQGAEKLLMFDEKGMLLNDVGETEELRKSGLLSGEGSASSSRFQLYLREPGGNLLAGYHPESTPDSWVPTLLSRRAVQGNRGSSASEYRDLLGRPVLGAWDWLPEWEMGIGAEEPLDHALAPMKPVRRVLMLISLAPLAILPLLLFGTGAFSGRRRKSPFGSYILERPIGRGGMAEVFLARHEILKRPAAVKILSNANPDEASIARFEREARLACRLGHPNAIQIFDYGETSEGKLYYAMEYVKGLNLAQLMSIESPLPVARAIYLLRQVAGALEEVHLLGMVHRDLKPSNIMVSTRGALGDVVKVLDFGIACSSLPFTDDVTRTVELRGTPAFIAPERIRAPQEATPRADVYSFGAVAFHLVTGRNVFEGPGPAEVIYQVMTAIRPSPSQLRGDPLPERLERLILDCLAVEPEKRPQSFREIQEILESISMPERWSQDKAREWWVANGARLDGYAQTVSSTLPPSAMQQRSWS